MLNYSKSQDIAHREACDECHRRKIRCLNGTGACLKCQATGHTCTFSPRKGMGRPKNGERKKGRRSDQIPPSDFNDAFKAPSSLRHDQYAFEPSPASASVTDNRVVTQPASLVEHGFLQDFPYNVSDWAPTTLPQSQHLVSSAPYRSCQTSNTPESAAQERGIYQNRPGDLSHVDFAMAGLYQHGPVVSSRAKNLSPSPNHCTETRHPSLDLFTRLSNIQMELWKRKDRAKKASEQQEPSSKGEFDGIIQTMSDICGIAKTAAALNHDMATPETSSCNIEGFCFQLMMSVSAALDILSYLEAPAAEGIPCTSKSQGRVRDDAPSSTLNLVRTQSSFFVLSSLGDSEHLNNILTLTSLDYYLSQIVAVLSSNDMTTKIDSLHQGVEDVVGRSQRVRQLISSSLHGLRAG
ncbi:MAG: hypothetical protein L6R37_004886 [Teloschistes peruensis]|nr:MAG: hypothetical protein L6R37_004886 [Teloschistes peruensis]